MTPISALTLAEAWLKGAEHLVDLDEMSDFSVLLEISKPMLVRRSDLEVARLLDSFLRRYEGFSNHTVAETIFPGSEYRRHGVEGVFKVYPEERYPLVREHPAHRWGTYAYRLLRRKKAEGTEYNPLEACIKKMRDKKRKHAVYEINLYDDTTDGKYRMGGPCLSHLSFKVMPGEKLHLTALYRLHYYVQRLYGNLLGLARLQNFVAAQAGLDAGPLVCHSTMAKLEVEGWRKADIKALLETCRTCYTVSAESAVEPSLGT